MSRIRSRDTRPELEIKAFLEKRGIKYQYQKTMVLGGKKFRVDFFIPSMNTVIEYRSCFWHRCPIHYKGVKGGILGRDWWERKLKRNAERDAELEKCLRENGYRLVVIWGHDRKRIERILGDLDG